MKKLITPLGALLSLIFIPSTWAYVNRMTLSYTSQQFAIGLYEMYRAAPALGFIILGLALVALILIVVPVFLKNPWRKTLIVGLSVISLVLLLAFLTFKSELSRNGEMIELGRAWFVSLLGFFIAFLGAFIKTRPAKAADGSDLPVRSSLPMISAVIVLICLPVSIFSYLFLTPPSGSFPLSVDGVSRATKVQYRKDETFPGVYGAVYGESLIHTVEKKHSAEEAKEQVRKIRESIKQESERSFDRWKSDEDNKIYDEGGEAQKYFQRDEYATYLAPEDKPENDYLVYVYGRQAQVVWASGNWLCTVLAPRTKVPTELADSSSAAAGVFDFARRLPYPPQNTTAPPVGENKHPFSVYEFIRFDLPLWFSEKALVFVPLLIAAPFVLLMLLRLGKRRTA